MNDETKSGAHPLDKRNPLRTGNFNKIILYVFLFMVLVLVAAIAFIKLGGWGSGGAKPTSTTPSNSRLILTTPLTRLA